MKVVYTDRPDGTVNGNARKYLKLPDGSRRQMYMPTQNGRNRRTVAKMVDDWVKAGGWDEIETNIITPPALIFTNGDFLDDWFKKKSGKWAATTRQTNTWVFNRHVRGDTKWWALPLSELKVQHVVEFLERIHGSSNVKHNVKRLIAGAYRQAVRFEYITVNPFELLEREEIPRKSKSRVEALSPDEEATLLRYVQPSPMWRAAVMVALDAGCGPAELLALHTDDLEPSGHLNIRHNCTDVRGHAPVIGPVKTGTGSARERRVLLSPDSQSALRGLLRPETAPDYFFLRDGRLWRGDEFRKAWASMLRQTGIRPYGFYSLRHTCATALLRAGMPIAAVSKRLGHANINTTLSHYAHALPAEADAGAAYTARRFASHAVAEVVEEPDLVRKLVQ